MKLGAFFLLGSPSMRPAGDVYRQTLEECAFAEVAGPGR